jgi:hypothetical protein
MGGRSAMQGGYFFLCRRHMSMIATTNLLSCTSSENVIIASPLSGRVTTCRLSASMIRQYWRLVNNTTLRQVKKPLDSGGVLAYYEHRKALPVTVSPRRFEQINRPKLLGPAVYLLLILLPFDNSIALPARNVNNLRRKPKDNSKFIIHHSSFFIFHYKNFAK